MSATSNTPMYTIGIAGGTGAGKSTLSRKLFEALGGAKNVTYLLHDSYYKDQSHKPMDERTQTNFDHPNALETELLVQHIRDLKAGKIVEVPTYDFTTHTRLPASHSVELAGPRPILLVEGILILCHPELVQEMDLKVFVDAEADVRLIRRMGRDCAERGRTVEQVVAQYHQTVRPMHLQYVEPSKCMADFVVHSSNPASDAPSSSLDVACNVLTNHLMITAGLHLDTPATTMEEAASKIHASS